MTDMEQVEAFAGQVVGDVAAALSGVMTNIGHKLGLYKAMAGAGFTSVRRAAETAFNIILQCRVS